MMYKEDSIWGGIGLFFAILILISLGMWIKENPTNLIWLILAGIIFLFVGKFFYDKRKQSQKIVKEGGMTHKYRFLLENLLAGHPNAKIFQVTSDSVILGVQSIGGITLYSLLQTFGKVTITWTMESSIYGKHKMEWDFDEYLDQKKMIEKIMNDLKQYQTNAMTAL